MDFLIDILTKCGLLEEDFDYHLIRASMVIIFFVFRISKMVRLRGGGVNSIYQQWPADFLDVPSLWYPRGELGFGSLGVVVWYASVFLGFWNKRLEILGALGSCVTFIMTVTIIPFMPNGWAASAGGFPAMTGNVPFLMKDVALFAASFYLLKQDVMRVSLSVGHVAHERRPRASDGNKERVGSRFQSSAIVIGAACRASACALALPQVALARVSVIRMTARHFAKRAPIPVALGEPIRSPSSPWVTRSSAAPASGFGAGIDLDAGTDALPREHLDERRPVRALLTDGLVVHDGAANGLGPHGARE